MFKKLSSPIKIQNYLDTLKMNWGETHMSPKMVLKAKKAHCFEGALLAAAALLEHGERPLLLDLKTADDDDDHVVALYKRNGYWGAISKTNHASLRFRDPIYRTVRELALSYFHEYFINRGGKKVLRSYSRPFDLRKFGREWINSENDLEYIAEVLDRSPHFPIVPKKNLKLIRPADKVERRAGEIVEWIKRH